VEIIIKVTRLNDSHLVVNADLIETVEATPDTVITLTTSNRMIVKEGVEEIVDRVIEYKRNLQIKFKAEEE